MRRTLVTEEEKAPVGFSAPQEQVESPRETVAPVLTGKTRPVRVRKAAPGGGRALRGGIILFSSIGLFALLVPTITGVPLNEWLQGANFKAAYSGNNLHFMRGSTALKLGNLAAATDAVLALSPESSEAQELAVGVFPRLVSAGDYARAVQVCKHMLPPVVMEGKVLGTAATTQFTDLNTQTPISSTVNLGAVAKQMVETMGVEKALAEVAKEPQLIAIRELMIPAIFSVLASQTNAEIAAQLNAQIISGKPGQLKSETWSLLEKLVPTLSGLSHTEAINSLVSININARRLASAWEWSLKLPVKQRAAQQNAMMSQLASIEPELALRLASTLRMGTENDATRQSVVVGVANTHLPEALRLLESIKAPTQRDMALLGLARSPAVKDKLPLIKQIVSPGVQIEALSWLLTTPVQDPEFLQQALPLFTELARQNQAYIFRHDEVMQHRAAQSKVKAEQESYLNRMLNAAARAKALQQWKDGKLASGIPGGGVGGGTGGGGGGAAIMAPAPPR